jgi:hypothetical protein
MDKVRLDMGSVAGMGGVGCIEYLRTFPGSRLEDLGDEHNLRCVLPPPGKNFMLFLLRLLDQRCYNPTFWLSLVLANW